MRPGQSESTTCTCLIQTGAGRCFRFCPGHLVHICNDLSKLGACECRMCIPSTPRPPKTALKPPQDAPRSPQDHPRPPQDPTQKSQRTKSTQNTCCSAGWRQVVGTTILCCDMYLPSRHTSPPQVSHLCIFDRKVWASGREEHLMLCKCFCLNRQAGESIGLKFFGSSRATGV